MSGYITFQPSDGPLLQQDRNRLKLGINTHSCEAGLISVNPMLTPGTFTPLALPGLPDPSPSGQDPTIVVLRGASGSGKSVVRSTMVANSEGSVVLDFLSCWTNRPTPKNHDSSRAALVMGTNELGTLVYLDVLLMETWPTEFRANNAPRDVDAAPFARGRDPIELYEKCKHLLLPEGPEGDRVDASLRRCMAHLMAESPIPLTKFVPDGARLFAPGQSRLKLTSTILATCLVKEVCRLFTKESVPNMIVIDLFGPESFDSNGPMQLLINTLNEIGSTVQNEKFNSGPRVASNPSLALPGKGMTHLGGVRLIQGLTSQAEDGPPGTLRTSSGVRAGIAMGLRDSCKVDPKGYAPRPHSPDGVQLYLPGPSTNDAITVTLSTSLLGQVVDSSLDDEMVEATGDAIGPSRDLNAQIRNITYDLKRFGEYGTTFDQLKAFEAVCALDPQVKPVLQAWGKTSALADFWALYDLVAKSEVIVTCIRIYSSESAVADPASHRYGDGTRLAEHLDRAYCDRDVESQLRSNGYGFLFSCFESPHRYSAFLPSSPESLSLSSDQHRRVHNGAISCDKFEYLAIKIVESGELPGSIWPAIALANKILLDRTSLTDEERAIAGRMVPFAPEFTGDLLKSATGSSLLLETFDKKDIGELRDVARALQTGWKSTITTLEAAESAWAVAARDSESRIKQDFAEDLAALKDSSAKLIAKTAALKEQAQSTKEALARSMFELKEKSKRRARQHLECMKSIKAVADRKLEILRLVDGAETDGSETPVARDRGRSSQWSFGSESGETYQAYSELMTTFEDRIKTVSKELAALLESTAAASEERGRRAVEDATRNLPRTQNVLVVFQPAVRLSKSRYRGTASLAATEGEDFGVGSDTVVISKDALTLGHSTYCRLSEAFGRVIVHSRSTSLPEAIELENEEDAPTHKGFYSKGASSVLSADGKVSYYCSRKLADPSLRDGQAVIYALNEPPAPGRPRAQVLCAVPDLDVIGSSESEGGLAAVAEREEWAASRMLKVRARPGTVLALSKAEGVSLSLGAQVILNTWADTIDDVEPDMAPPQPLCSLRPDLAHSQPTDVQGCGEAPDDETNFPPRDPARRFDPEVAHRAQPVVRVDESKSGSAPARTEVEAEPLQLDWSKPESEGASEDGCASNDDEEVLEEPSDEEVSDEEMTTEELDALIQLRFSPMFEPGQLREALGEEFLEAIRTVAVPEVDTAATSMAPIDCTGLEGDLSTEDISNLFKASRGMGEEEESEKRREFQFDQNAKVGMQSSVKCAPSPWSQGREDGVRKSLAYYASQKQVGPHCVLHFDEDKMRLQSIGLTPPVEIMIGRRTERSLKDRPLLHKGIIPIQCDFSHLIHNFSVDAENSKLKGSGSNFSSFLHSCVAHFLAKIGISGQFEPPTRDDARVVLQAVSTKEPDRMEEREVYFEVKAHHTSAESQASQKDSDRKADYVVGKYMVLHATQPRGDVVYPMIVHSMCDEKNCTTMIKGSNFYQETKRGFEAQTKFADACHNFNQRATTEMRVLLGDAITSHLERAPPVVKAERTCSKEDAIEQLIAVLKASSECIEKSRSAAIADELARYGVIDDEIPRRQPLTATQPAPFRVVAMHASSHFSAKATFVPDFNTTTDEGRMTAIEACRSGYAQGANDRLIVIPQPINNNDYCEHPHQVISRSSYRCYTVEDLLSPQYHALITRDNPVRAIKSRGSGNFRVFEDIALRSLAFQNVYIQSQLCPKISTSAGAFFDRDLGIGICWRKRGKANVYSVSYYAETDPSTERPCSPGDLGVGLWSKMRSKDGSIHYQSPTITMTPRDIQFATTLYPRMLSTLILSLNVSMSKFRRCVVYEGLCSLSTVYCSSTWQTSLYAGDARFLTMASLSSSPEVFAIAASVAESHSKRAIDDKELSIVAKADTMYLRSLIISLQHSPSWCNPDCTPIWGFPIEMMSLEKDIGIGMQWHIRGPQHARRCVKKLIKRWHQEENLKIAAEEHQSRQIQFMDELLAGHFNLELFHGLIDDVPMMTGKRGEITVAPHYNHPFFVGCAQAFCSDRTTVLERDNSHKGVGLTSIISDHCSYRLQPYQREVEGPDGSATVQTVMGIEHAKVHDELSDLLIEHNAPAGFHILFALLSGDEGFPASHKFGEGRGQNLSKIEQFFTLHPKDSRGGEREISTQSIRMRVFQAYIEGNVNVLGKNTPADMMEDAGKCCKYVEAFSNVLKRRGTVTSLDKSFFCGWQIPQFISCAIGAVAEVTKCTEAASASIMLSALVSRTVGIPDDAAEGYHPRMCEEIRHALVRSPTRMEEKHSVHVVRLHGHMQQGILARSAAVISTVIAGAIQVFQSRLEPVFATGTFMTTSDDQVRGMPGVKHDKFTNKALQTEFSKRPALYETSVMMLNNQEKEMASEQFGEFNNMVVGPNGIIPQNFIQVHQAIQPLLGRSLFEDLTSIYSFATSVISWGNSPDVTMLVVYTSLQTLRNKWLLDDKAMEGLVGKGLIPTKIEDVLTKDFLTDEKVFERLLIRAYKRKEDRKKRDAQRGLSMSKILLSRSHGVMMQRQRAVHGDHYMSRVHNSPPTSDVDEACKPEEEEEFQDIMQARGNATQVLRQMRFKTSGERIVVKAMTWHPSAALRTMSISIAKARMRNVKESVNNRMLYNVHLRTKMREEFMEAVLSGYETDVDDPEIKKAVEEARKNHVLMQLSPPKARVLPLRPKRSFFLPRMNGPGAPSCTDPKPSRLRLLKRSGITEGNPATNLEVLIANSKTSMLEKIIKASVESKQPGLKEFKSITGLPLFRYRDIYGTSVSSKLSCFYLTSNEGFARRTKRLCTRYTETVNGVRYNHVLPVAIGQLTLRTADEEIRAKRKVYLPFLFDAYSNEGQWTFFFMPKKTKSLCAVSVDRELLVDSNDVPHRPIVILEAPDPELQGGTCVVVCPIYTDFTPLVHLSSHQLSKVPTWSGLFTGGKREMLNVGNWFCSNSATAFSFMSRVYSRYSSLRPKEYRYHFGAYPWMPPTGPHEQPFPVEEHGIMSFIGTTSIRRLMFLPNSGNSARHVVIDCHRAQPVLTMDEEVLIEAVAHGPAPRLVAHAPPTQ